MWKIQWAVKSHYWPLMSATISKQHECFHVISLAKQNHKLSAVAECSSMDPHLTHMTSESFFSFFKLLVALSFPCMLHLILQGQTRLQEIFHTEDCFGIMGNRENCQERQRIWSPCCSDLVTYLLEGIKCLKLKENYEGHLVVINERCRRAFALW